MRRIFNKIDKPLLFLTIISLIFGLMMIGSASALKSYMTYGENYHFLKKQLFLVAVGIVGAIIILKNPIKSYKFLIKLAVAAIIGMLIYVLLKGEVTKGIKGWISIGPATIQPSEFAKTALIIYLALAFEKLVKIKNVGIVRRFLPFIIPIIFILLVYKQPDFGTMIVLAGISAVIFLIVPYEPKTKWIITIFTIISITILITTMVITGKGFTSKQMERFKFKEPCTRYREETGYQVCNGYIAINSGGLLGSGIGNSKQKYLYLPEAHTDFIFAIIIEETGLITGLLMLLSYFIIVWRIILIGRKSYNIQGTIICYGVATYIALHVIINLGGVLGIIPLTGIPLPFYSYGGSFIFNLILCLAFVQRVCIENKIFEQKHLVA